MQIISLSNLVNLYLWCNLSLLLISSMISPSNHSSVLFFTLVSWRGAAKLTISENCIKKVIYFIMLLFSSSFGKFTSINFSWKASLSLYSNDRIFIFYAYSVYYALFFLYKKWEVVWKSIFNYLILRDTFSWIRKNVINLGKGSFSYMGISLEDLWHAMNLAKSIVFICYRCIICIIFNHIDVHITHYINFLVVKILSIFYTRLACLWDWDSFGGL